MFHCCCSGKREDRSWVFYDGWLFVSTVRRLGSIGNRCHHVGGLKALSGPSTVGSSVRKVRMSLLPPELFKISYPGPVILYRLAKLVSACRDERRNKTVMVIRIILL